MKSVKFPWLKIYLTLIIAFSLAFVGYNLFAATVETPGVLKQYIKGGDCPQFSTTDSANFNDLTMKDSCTGLVWSRYELPTYHGTAEPGYSWQEASDACAALAPAGMFRLPTVEELLSLLKYQCNGSNCTPALPDEILTTPNAAGSQNVKPFFSNGTYWSQTDFNQPASWTIVNSIPPGNPARDYKRSVNLNNGKVDSPTYNNRMKLNAWCIVDRNPNVLETKFISATETGNSVSNGNLKTVYNRKCTQDSDCAALGSTVCENGFCAKTENNVAVSPSRLVRCSASQHIENGSCVNNPSGNSLSVCALLTSQTNCNNNPACLWNTTNSNCQPSCPPPNSPTTDAYLKWQGNVFNGYKICILNSCSDPVNYHIDPDTFLCAFNQKPCNLPSETVNLSWVLKSINTWVGADWGACQASQCTYNAQPSGTPAICQCGVTTGSVIREGVCTICAAGNHYETLTLPVGQDITRDNCLAASGGVWTGAACVSCRADIGADCSTMQNSVPVDQKTLDWTGGLLSGSSQCTFHNCATGYHEEPAGSQVCVPDAKSCTLTTTEDPYALTLTATQTWNGTDYGPCQSATCNSSAALVSGICTCPSPKIIFDQGVCQLCGNGTVDAGEICDSGSSSRGFGVCIYEDKTYGKVATCSLIPTGSLPPKTVQAVFIVDTSPSIGSPMANLCAVRKAVQGNLLLAGYNTTIDIYGISDNYNLAAGAGTAAGACAASINDTQNNTQNVVQNIYWQYSFTAGCNYIYTGCLSRTTSSSCGSSECVWDTTNSKCLANNAFCNNQTSSGTCTDATHNLKCSWDQCNNIAQGACDSYNQTDCTSHQYCQWDASNGCSRNNNYCWGGKTQAQCTFTPPAPQCQWLGNKVSGCGDGYVYSNNVYPTTFASGLLANPVKLQASTTFCPEDWVSSAITTIQKLSNTSNPVQWTTDSDRELVLLFDESPFNGYGGSGEAWINTDYQHMQSSLRTATLGLSLINIAQANNVKISLVFARALTPTNTSCPGWTWPTSNYNTDQNKYCAFKKIADETGGTVQFGASIMSTPASTATVITTAIQLSATDKFCDKVGGGTGGTQPDGILDCQWR